MDNEQSAESVDNRQQADEGLSPEEQAVAVRGREYRRYLLAAAALHEIYTVGDLASAVGVSAGTVQGWWRGAQPQAATLPKIARALGFTTEALFAWFYGSGGPPGLADPEQDARARLATRARPADEASAAPPAPHEIAGSGR